MLPICSLILLGWRQEELSACVAQIISEAFFGSVPLWGGVGGGGSNWRMQLCAITTTPLPSPPPQGGREQTAVAARADSISTASALVPLKREGDGSASWAAPASR